ncbi:AAA family ATPase [Gordonia sp. (in: high G+C Gram-positive bacteria)]|mgnify:CR=1 FL=1|jgi:Cdc6-like AAA superfamily ATPase|uniref:AAA family ATPase n=1 Tax=Gordonia sp. (in: high G+C Gram-positive bacteria) TaxID=84139 RepID=UPI001D2EC391|nr:AAA family ATPase [Gordonia sp. (in: high G+C Gram-positive bacteria)]MCB1296508.1 orc1/cdc6 family replication initiation protein [Gordonia sp. (in: high G+C Gram-positive bacteria)]HMS75551.1 AAA family ATPase [Gordonia sp. (in: high G+C Gram-positive bacteria)]HQV17064.1 AAA family ATPase [Gordonia sp. (in: high G+C Gram-positive bacteria)]
MPTPEEIDAKIARRAALNREFTPSTPVNRRAAFSGRIDQIMQITAAVTQPGRHAILYGERGVGKTSLANILSELLVPTETDFRDYAVRVNCTVDDTFDTIWRRAFDELGLPSSEVPERFDKLNPDQLRRILARVKPPMVIVLDEYDRVEDDDALSLIADTIKSLSDHAVETKLVIVGVADSIESLVGEHESIWRAIEEVPMPRMTADELRELVNKGFEAVSIEIESAAVERIVKLSEGLPSYAHLLSLKVGELVLADDRDKILLADVVSSTDAVVNSAVSNRMDYHKAIRSSRPENLYPHVLAACALAKKDGLGYFTAKSVVEPMSRIMGKKYDIPAFSRHLSSFISDDRGCVLLRHGETKRYTYRFKDPMMQPFAILAAIAGGLIPQDYQEELFTDQRIGSDWDQAAKRLGNNS